MALGPQDPWAAAQKAMMKKAMSLVLEESDLLELYRVLIDEDAEGALAFLQRHLKSKAFGLLEAG